MHPDPYEITGFVFGVAGVWLTIRQNIWCFPIGLVNVMIYAILFYRQQLYSDAIQQIVYIILLSYGWMKWFRGEKENTLLITKSSSALIMQIAIAVVLLAVIMGTFFKYYTHAAVPYLDAFATSMSFSAQWLIAKKKIENWLIWIDVNLLYIGIYCYKHLWLTAFLFLIYLILAINGYYKWKKELNKYAFT